LCCRTAALQGLDDKVVPPNQAQVMYDALKARGVSTALVMFEGEQHGFRKAPNIRQGNVTVDECISSHS
jgi:dipeptidyl aminopeptidase/acylaminoacyl peptidase